MRIIISGVHGFVGSSVGFRALNAGHEVLGFDLPTQPPAGWTGDYQQSDVAFADLTAPIDEFRPDFLFHAAGTASVEGSYSNPLADLRAAVSTWANALDCIRRSTCRPLAIYPSSAAVYGNPLRLPVTEEAPVSPISPYGFHKAACELLAREYSTCFSLNILVVRLFSVYGPRQKRLLLWELFQQAIGEERELLLSGTGNERRDYSHVDDVADTLLSLAAKSPEGLRSLNLASGISIQTAQLARLVAKAVGCNKTVRPLGKGQKGKPTNWSADISQLAALTDHDSRSLLEGIEECVGEWR